MTDNLAIIVSNVSKNFRLPHERAGSIKSLFTNPFKKRSSGVEIQHALDDVSFTIKKGEFFGIVGRNGSGKSTLLKMLAGIYQTTSGKIHTAGRLVPFIELGVGFNPELSGRDNVYLNGALLGFSRREIDAMYKDIVGFAELERFMDQKLKNYSSGMQVRLAFSMAIRADADILLIDEVLAVGDADFQKKCFDHFKQLKKLNKTVVLVSHDMSAIREFCDRAVLIDKSKVVAEGNASKIADKYNMLFSEHESKIYESDQKRWGTQEVFYESVKVDSTETNIHITAHIKSDTSLKRVLFGINIAGQDGKDIIATNNRLILKKDLTQLHAGKKLKIEWNMMNVLGDGRYYVTTTLTDPISIVYDWYTDAASFVVKKKEKAATPVLPPIDVSISEVR